MDRAFLRGVLLSYAFLAMLWVAASQVPRMNVLAMAACTFALAMPATLALWHHGTVRRLLALHQFRPGRPVHRWFSRRALGLLWRAALVISLSAAVLLQSVFFDGFEWLLLGLAPLLFLASRRLLLAATLGQFTHPVYADHWSSRTAQWLVILALAATWVFASLVPTTVPGLPYAERIHQLQSAWAQSPSGTIRWALDAGAWGQASLEAMGQQAGLTGWGLLLALVVAPVSVFSFAVLSVTGLGLPVDEIRRTLGAPPTLEPSPPAVGALRAARWATVAGVGALMLLVSLGGLDRRLRPSDSPLAVSALPECERIGGKVYALNTASALKVLFEETQHQFANHRRDACTRLSEIEAIAAKGVDQYLDWYFSLGAEMTRFATLLTGDLDLLMQAKFHEKVIARPEILERLPGVQAAYEAQWAALVTARAGALDLLERNQLVLDERACKVVKDASATPWSAHWDASKARLAGGAGAGIIAGTLAAKATARAMGKATMKSAGAVLAKATARKGIGKAGAAAVGAAAGTAVAPGLGTLLGAAIGAGVGVAVGTSVDMVALAAEEKLNRDEMRKDLLVAVSETLQPYRDTFECSATRTAGLAEGRSGHAMINR